MDDSFDGAAALMGHHVKVFKGGVDQRRTALVVGYTRHPYAVRVRDEEWAVTEEALVSDLLVVD
jgi:hypothetical protein